MTKKNVITSPSRFDYIRAFGNIPNHYFTTSYEELEKMVLDDEVNCIITFFGAYAKNEIDLAEKIHKLNPNIPILVATTFDDLKSPDPKIIYLPDPKMLLAAVSAWTDRKN